MKDQLTYLFSLCVSLFRLWLMMLEASSLLYTIGSLICVVHCRIDHEDDFILELKELLPCLETEAGTNVSLHKSDILAVQANLTLCSNSSWSNNQFNAVGYIAVNIIRISPFFQPDGTSLLQCYEQGNLSRIDNHIQMNLEVRVYLNCNHSTKTPIITTTGDSVIRHTYVFNISSCDVCPGGCGSNVRIPILCPPVLGEPSCICQHPDGIINLTPYANLSGDARFSLQDGSGATYFYNPCQTFHKYHCWNAHVCMATSVNISVTMGRAESETMYIDPDTGEVHVFYAGPSETQVRVHLSCDHSVPQQLPAMTFASGSTCPLALELNLKSCQVCPGGCNINQKD